MNAAMVRLALRSAAVLIGIMAVIDPVWSSSRPSPRELIAIHLASHHPGLVSRLILVASAGVRADVPGPGTMPWPEHGACGRLVILRVEADGFLRHMVRAIAGTLVEVGEGRREPSVISALLDSRSRAASGATAPAHGLVLASVRYPAPAGPG